MELAGLILAILGLFGWPLILRLLDRTLVEWWYRFTWSKCRVRDAAQKVLERHLIPFSHLQNTATYSTTPVMVSWYVDFLSAVTHADERRALERCLVRWLQLRLNRRPDRIAVPKLGNVLLADTVARRLNLPLVIIRQDAKTFIRGDSIDGEVLPGEMVLLIDDVASDCDFLNRCIMELQEAKADVVGVVVVVNRKEGRCCETIGRRGIAFESILTLGDPELKTLAARRSLFVDDSEVPAGQ